MGDSSLNHQIDPTTGFTENHIYAYAFDSDKKVAFLDRYRANGLSLYTTCSQMGLSHKTVLKHYREDAAFKEAFDETERVYFDQLEGVSRNNALNDRSVVERIFQLNAGSRRGLTRGKYTDDKSGGPTTVVINVDADLLKAVVERDRILDATPIPQNSEPSTDLSQRDHAA